VSVAESIRAKAGASTDRNGRLVEERRNFESDSLEEQFGRREGPDQPLDFSVVNVQLVVEDDDRVVVLEVEVLVE